MLFMMWASKGLSLMSEVVASGFEIASKLQEDQYVMLDCKQSPLSQSEYKMAEALIDRVTYEDVCSGDAGDKHSLKVGRFRRDVEYPKNINPLSSLMMEVINSKKMQLFYQQFTGFDQVCVRRVQSNILNEGNYVGLHTDGVGDSKYKGTHIDYKYAIVLHFSSCYEGGDTVLYSPGGKVVVALPVYSMLIITGALPHEVRSVRQGQRRTLAYFLSDNFGQSKYE